MKDLRILMAMGFITNLVASVSVYIFVGGWIAFIAVSTMLTIYMSLWLGTYVIAVGLSVD